MIHILSIPLFGAIFGALFTYVGVSRILTSRRAATRGEVLSGYAIGGISAVFGVACACYCLALLFGLISHIR